MKKKISLILIILAIASSFIALIWTNKVNELIFEGANTYAILKVITTVLVVLFLISVLVQKRLSLFVVQYLLTILYLFAPFFVKLSIPSTEIVSTLAIFFYTLGSIGYLGILLCINLVFHNYKAKEIKVNETKKNIGAKKNV
jgi:hypothetical protein